MLNIICLGLLFKIWYPVLKTATLFSYTEQVIREEVNPNFNVIEKCGEASYYFINADPIIDLPRPISAKILYIGGVGIEKVEPLNEVSSI